MIYKIFESNKEEFEKIESEYFNKNCDDYGYCYRRNNHYYYLHLNRELLIILFGYLKNLAIFEKNKELLDLNLDEIRAIKNKFYLQAEQEIEKLCQL